MRMKHLMLSTAASLAVALMTSGLSPIAAQAAAGLAGQVTGPEGPMEGVLVTAKKNGSTIAYTVTSDAQGRYSFPAGKIEGGEYTLHIRATGFDLDGANRDGALKANVDAQNATTADLKLKKTHNLAGQLVNAEWMMSMPGTDDQKAQLLNCVGCHTLERIVRSTHNADEFTQVVYRMANYAQVSQPIKPQKRMDPEWAPKPEIVPQVRGIPRQHQSLRSREVGVCAARRCRARPAAPPRCWSPNTTCRARPSSRMT